MESNSEVTALIRDHEAAVKQLYDLTDKLDEVSKCAVSCIQNDGKIFWMGNGGSASACQHLAAELVGRFQLDRDSLPSVALTTDTSVLTAVSNDYGFESVFSRQIEALCTNRDMVIGLSTSGESPNIINGIEKANGIGAVTFGLAGQKTGTLGRLTDFSLNISSQSTARIQEMHLLCGHIICGTVEKLIFGH